MNNIFVYIENEGGKVADVCLELLTKGRELATTLRSEEHSLNSSHRSQSRMPSSA